MKTDFEVLNTFVSDKVPSGFKFKIPSTNHMFIRIVLSNLDANKSTALDIIGPIILKLSANVITPSLLFVVYNSISFSNFPSVWKDAKVNPYLKLVVKKM